MPLTKTLQGLMAVAPDNRGTNDFNHAADRHCPGQRHNELLSLLGKGMNFHFSRVLPDIVSVLCFDRLIALRADDERRCSTFGTVVSTVIRLYTRHEAWQEPGVIKTRMPCL